jgi:hypothetical protein
MILWLQANRGFDPWGVGRDENYQNPPFALGSLSNANNSTFQLFNYQSILLYWTARLGADFRMKYKDITELPGCSFRCEKVRCHRRILMISPLFVSWHQDLLHENSGKSYLDNTKA